uniref:Uncharacterized protein n=1 Tax=Magallana gigas TaxID=29159 RepID=A0A8W8NVW5_MAGGI
MGKRDILTHRENTEYFEQESTTDLLRASRNAMEKQDILNLRENIPYHCFPSLSSCDERSQLDRVSTLFAPKMNSLRLSFCRFVCSGLLPSARGEKGSGELREILVIQETADGLVNRCVPVREKKRSTNEEVFDVMMYMVNTDTGSRFKSTLAILHYMTKMTT